jgi:hypothetical protein
MPGKKKRPGKAQAVKVDPANALLPKPTATLLEEIAMGIHLSVAGAAAVQRNENQDEYPDWSKLPDDVKDYWIEGARCAYSIIAIHGGAEVTPLNYYREK